MACEERRENLYDRVYSNDGGGGGGLPKKTTHCRYNIFGLSSEPNISEYPLVSSIIIILWPVDSYLFFLLLYLLLNSTRILPPAFLFRQIINLVFLVPEGGGEGIKKYSSADAAASGDETTTDDEEPEKINVIFNYFHSHLFLPHRHRKHNTRPVRDF